MISIVMSVLLVLEWSLVWTCKGEVPKSSLSSTTRREAPARVLAMMLFFAAISSSARKELPAMRSLPRTYVVETNQALLC